MRSEVAAACRGPDVAAACHDHQPPPVVSPSWLLVRSSRCIGSNVSILVLLVVVVVATPTKARYRAGRYGAPPQDGEPKVDVMKAGTALHPKLAPLNIKGPRAHAPYVAHNHYRIMQYSMQAPDSSTHMQIMYPTLPQ